MSVFPTRVYLLLPPTTSPCFAAEAATLITGGDGLLAKATSTSTGASAITTAGTAPLGLLLGGLVLPQLLGDAADAALGEHLLEVVEDVVVLVAEEGEGDAALAGTAGTADTVRVRLDVVGHVEVDDERDVGHVDAAARQVRRDQHVRLALAHRQQGRLALLLRLGPVQRDRAEAHRLDVARDGVAVALDIDKDDDGRAEFSRRQDLVQSLLALVFAGHKFHALLHRVDGFADVADGHDRGPAQVFARNPFHRRRHGRRVHHCLTVSVLATDVAGHGAAVLGRFRVGLLVAHG